MQAFENDQAVVGKAEEEGRFDPSLLYPRRGKTRVHFDAFPMGRWEVVWLGDVGYHSRCMLYSQPTVTVVLASLDEPSIRLSEIKLPVAQLFAAYLGSVWDDKVRTDEMSVDAERRKIVLATGQAIPCAVGVGLEEELNGEFMLPFEDFPHHRGHTKSWCLRVARSEAIYIFPALELIRFYFGSSGSLLKQVFSPGLDVNRLATETSLHDGLAKVTLSHDMPSVSAADIARIVFDKVAQSAAKLVGASLQAASSIDSYGKLYPRAAFPFLGITELSLVGVHIQARQGKPRFLVRRVISCSAVFPFKQLEYVASNRSKMPSSPMSGGHNKTSGKPQLAARRNTTGPLANMEPKNSRTSQNFALAPEARFTDLARKTVCRVDGEAARQVLLSHLPSLPYGSTGDGTLSAQGAKCEMTLEDDQRKILWKFATPMKAWKPFFVFLNWLARDPWVEHFCFVPLDSRQAQPHYRALPELIDSDGVLIDETMAIAGLPRMASLINIKTKSGSMAILSISPNNCADNTAMATPHFSFTPTESLSQLAAIITQRMKSYSISIEEAASSDGFFKAREALRLAVEHGSTSKMDARPLS